MTQPRPTQCTPTLELTLEANHSPMSVKSDDAQPTSYKLVPQSGAVTGIEFDGSKEVVVGRDKSVCTHCFEEATLSRQHCKIYSIGREVVCVDMSSNGTYINGKKLGKGNRKILHTGDVIGVGDVTKEDTKLAWVFVSSEKEREGGGDLELSKAYALSTVLGTGNFAVVKLGTCLRTGKRVAVKVIDKKKFALQDDFDMSSLFAEVEILRKMSHKNVIGIHDVFDSKDALCIVLELVNNGDLFDYIAGRVGKMGPGIPYPFTEDEAKALFAQLIEAILYLHSRGVAHRDLKPENILLLVADGVSLASRDAQVNAPKIHVKDATLKITDFGLAKYCGDHAVMTTMCGTPTYLAPEVIDKKSAGAGYSKLVDVWSLGVMLYIMLSGVPPKDPQSGRLEFPSRFFSHTSETVRELITKMLQVKPENRFGLREIISHAWLKDFAITGRELAEPHGGFVPPVAREATTVLSPDVPLVAAVTSTDTATDIESDGDAKQAAPAKKVSKRQRTADDGPRAGQWYWKSNADAIDADPKAWTAYAPDVNAKLENAFARKFKTCKIDETYRASLVDLFQYRHDDNERQRPIKRI